jgi:hypothetical protein
MLCDIDINSISLPNLVTSPAIYLNKAITRMTSEFSSSCEAENNVFKFLITFTLSCPCSVPLLQQAIPITKKLFPQAYPKLNKFPQSMMHQECDTLCEISFAE